MLALLERTATVVGWVTETLAKGMLAFVAFILVAQVVLRYVFLAPLPWPEEAARYLMIWVVMLAGSLLVKDEQLVSVDFLDHLWPKRWLLIRNIVFRVALACMLVVLFWVGIDLATFSAGRRTTALQISWYWPYLAVAVGAGLMLFHMFVLAVRDLVRGPKVPDEPTIARAEN